MIKNKGCDCKKCKSCCWRSPGWFGSMKEVKGSAKIVGMSVKDFAKEFLIREWWAGKGEDVFVPAPRRNFGRLSKEKKKLEKEMRFIGLWKDEELKNCKGFVRASWGHNLMSGYACIFLTKDERCIVHESKPTECRETFGCKKSTNRKIREQMSKYWKKHQDFISYLME